MTRLRIKDTSKTPSIFDKVTATIATGTALYNMGRGLHNWYQNKHIYTIKVTESDTLFNPLIDWIDERLVAQEKRPRHLEAITSNKDDYYIYEDNVASTPPPKVKFLGSQSTTQDMLLNGHTIRVSIETPEASSENGAITFYADKRLMEKKIHFACQSFAAHEAVKEAIKQISGSLKAGKSEPRIYVRSSYGGWSRRNDVQLRPLESVILPSGQKERIVEDVQLFLDSEDEYKRRGIPHHRGYLFHGIAGTGKTSTAKALAQHFGLDLYYAPLGDAKSDTELINTLSDIRPRSMLILEDVDVFAATVRKETNNSASLSGVLNALDGVMTPPGLITIMTTNNIDALDPAILRAGRMDLIEELGALTSDQANRIFRHFYGRDPNRNLPGQGTPAELFELFKQHFNDPDTAEEQALALRYVRV